MSAEITKKKFHEVNKLRASGLGVVEACKQARLSPKTFYTVKSQLETKPYKPRKLLNITELPSFVPKVGNLFMVYGSPDMLASFAKGMS